MKRLSNIPLSILVMCCCLLWSSLSAQIDITTVQGTVMGEITKGTLESPINGDYFVYGNIKDPTGGNLDQVFLHRLDHNLNFQNGIVLQNPNGRLEIVQAEESANGGIFLVGNVYMSPTQRDIFAFLLDPTFGIVWGKIYNRPDFDNVATDMILLPDESLIISGYTQEPSGTGNYKDFLALKTDITGNFIWGTRSGQDMINSSDWHEGLILTPSGTARAYGGASAPYAGGGLHDAYFVDYDLSTGTVIAHNGLPSPENEYVSVLVNQPGGTFFALGGVSPSLTSLPFSEDVFSLGISASSMPMASFRYDINGVGNKAEANEVFQETSSGRVLAVSPLDGESDMVMMEFNPMSSAGGMTGSWLYDGANNETAPIIGGLNDLVFGGSTNSYPVSSSTDYDMALNRIQLGGPIPYDCPLVQPEVIQSNINFGDPYQMTIEWFSMPHQMNVYDHFFTKEPIQISSIDPCGPIGCDIAILDIVTFDESCPGAMDGSVEVYATCSTCCGIEYSVDGITWSPTPIIGGLSNGTHTVYARDVCNPDCITSNPFDIFLISQSCCDLSIDDIIVGFETCPGSCDGFVDVQASCTTCTSIEYSIDGGMTWQASNIFTGLCEGTHQVIARDTGNPNCVETITFTIPPATDTENPTVTCTDITINLSASGMASIVSSDVATWNDNCGVVDWNVSPWQFTCNNLGPNTVTVTVWDAAGNSASCTAVVTVLDPTGACGSDPCIDDIEPPVVVCNDITIDIGTGGTTTTPTVSILASDVAQWTDNCEVVDWNVDPYIFDCSNLGPNTVTVTVWDAAGNSATCTAIVTVTDLLGICNDCSNDTQPPVVVCNDITIDIGTGGTTVTPTVSIVASDVAQWTDNCQVVDWSVDPYIFDCSNLGPNIVTVTVWDAAGNSSSCTAIVTITDANGLCNDCVNDTQPPVVFCQDITLPLDNSGNASLYVAGTIPSVIAGWDDNCGVVDWSITPGYFDCGDLGPNIVTVTVWDAAGNSASCTAIVTITDPNNVCPSDICSTPTNITHTVVDPTTVTICWDPVPGATKYQVRYRLKGTTTWIVAGTFSTCKTFTGLQTSRWYEYRVRALCPNNTWTPFSDLKRFYVATCEPPTQFSVNFLDIDKVKIIWNPVPGATKYQVRYRIVGTSSWTSVGSVPGNNFKTITGLTPGEIYQYRVRSSCGGTHWSYLSDLQHFDLGSQTYWRLGSEEVKQSTIGSGNVYPNPAISSIGFEFELNVEGNVNISISDLLGQTVYHQSEYRTAGEQNGRIDISSFEAGYYLLTIQTEDGFVKTFKFIKRNR